MSDVIKDKRKIIILSLVAVAAIWVMEAAIDSLLFKKGEFCDLLIFNVPHHNIFHRALFITSLIILGMITAKIISKRTLTEDALRESEEKLRTIADTAKDAIVMMDDNGYITFWNPAAETIFGYSGREAIGKELHAFLGPERYHDAYRKGFSKFRETGEGAAVGKMLELYALRKDGTEFPIELSLSAIQIKGRWYASGIIRDITERKKAEEGIRKHQEQLKAWVEERTMELTAANEKLKQEVIDRSRSEEKVLRSERFLNTIFDSVRDPFSIVDRNYRIIRVNDAYAEMRNKSPQNLLGKKCYEILQNRKKVCDDCVVEKTFNSSDPCAKEKLLTFPNGSEVWVEIYTYPILTKKGKVSHVIEYTRDVTERKKAEHEKKNLIEKLEYLSTTDSLTGLLNRRALGDMLQREIERANRYGSELSLVICDIDNFKEINDNHGHAAGDRALQIVSDTIKGTLRKSDILGRHGGDEFMLILPETTTEGAKNLAEKIRHSVEKTVFLLSEGKAVKISLSLGVTGFRTATEDTDALVKRADHALYSSKQAGKNKVSTIKA